MRLAMYLTTALVTLALLGCSSGSDDAPSGAAGAALAETGQTPPDSTGSVQTPVDYTKVTCSGNADCTKACEYTNPATTEALIRANYCGGQPQSAFCDSLVKFHLDTYLVGRNWCKSLPVTNVIDPDLLGSTACGDSPTCSTYCQTNIVPRSDEAIEREAAAAGSLNSGATYKTLIRNQVVRERLASCLAAPRAFIQAIRSN